MASTVINGVDAAVTRAWRTYDVLGDSGPDSPPEEPDHFRKLRSSTSLNSLRMSLRKRLPLKSVQSNVNVPEDLASMPTQKTKTVHKLARTAKNSIGGAYQKIQKSLRSREDCLVRTPGAGVEGDENDFSPAGISCTPRRLASGSGPFVSGVTPKRVTRSATKRTPQAAHALESSDSAVRAVRTGRTRRQLVRMAALQSPFASPETMNQRRQFERDLDSVSSGLRKLKRLSRAFDDIIGRDDRSKIRSSLIRKKI